MGPQLTASSIEFDVFDVDLDWWRNELSYAFAPIREGDVRIRVSKLRNREVRVDVIGILGGWFTLSATLPNLLPNGVARFRIDWTPERVSMAINGQVVLSEDPRTGVDDNASAIAQALSILGTGWAQGELTSAARASSQLSHPLLAFYREYKDLAPHSQRGSIGAAKYGAIGRALGRASKFKHFDSLLSRLRNPESFRDTVAECLASEVLWNLGGGVEFNLAIGGGVKSHDLNWTPQYGKQELVLPAEVKRVHDYNSVRANITSKHWPTIRDRIDKAAISARLHLDVFAMFKGTPTEEGIKTVLRALTSETALAHWRPIASTPLVDVWVREAAIGEFTDFVADLPEVGNMDTINLEVRAVFQGKAPLGSTPTTTEPFVRMHVPAGEGVIADPRIIALDLDEPRQRVANFVGAFRGAVQQLPKDGPGVVVIELPRPSRPELSAYVEWVTGQFGNGLFSRVNMLLLFWIDDRPEGYTADGRSLIKPSAAIEVHVVDNPSARHPIPLGTVRVPPNHREPADGVTAMVAEASNAPEQGAR